MNVIYAPRLFLYCFGCLVGIIIPDTTGMEGGTSLYELCPYNDYCTSDAIHHLEDDKKAPCCGYCSCADDCWKRGNCCPDKQKIIERQPLETCDAALVKPSAYRHHITNTDPQYYVIKSCPKKDDALAEQCREELQSALEDFIWVTDRRTNRIYNNKHCAICHGVESYTPWQISTDCIGALNGQISPNDVVNHIIDKCSLTVVPPGTNDNTGQCLMPEYTKCNLIVDWVVYDQAMENACNNFSQIYIEENTYRTKVYKNIYCFLCNSPRDKLVRDVCISYAASRERTGKLGFTGLLDFEGIERAKEFGATDELGHGPVCDIDEIKDPFKVFTCFS